jgi:hypothetical protein
MRVKAPIQMSSLRLVTRWDEYYQAVDCIGVGYFARYHGIECNAYKWEWDHISIHEDWRLD